MAEASPLDNMSTDELMERLGQLGLQTTGSRAVLRERLRKALGMESHAERDDDDTTKDDAGDIDGLRINSCSDCAN